MLWWVTAMTQALHSETFPHWKSESSHSFQLSATGNWLPPQQSLWIASSSKANAAQTMVWQGWAGRLKESSPPSLRAPAGPPRLAQNEVKWAISAGVQGPGLSVTLSGAEWEEWTWNADSLRSEAPRGPRRPRYPFPPLGGEQIMIRGPDPAAPKSQVTLRDSRKSARKSARARACVCHTGRILMQSRDQLAHLLLLALCLLRLWSGSPESRHTRMQLAGRENCSEDERGDDERTM